MFNIFTLAALAIVLAISIAILVTRQKTPGQQNRVPPEDDAAEPQHFIPSFSIVEETARRICEENGLKVINQMPISDRETYWVAQSENPVFFGQYVFGFYRVDGPEICVTMATLLEFKDFVKSVGSSKGFFFTNGFFTRDVHQPLEGPKVALFNARKIREERSQKGVA
ncbi:MAG: hypothetical protein HYR96_00935 [Deltaproteobacteria bacterium]|nr:hypothetical protein [Deltaproteobacteria bacterium]MBI3293865.1 hypothetical protein [Deltaproteobacteria bacterium]